MQSAFIEYFKRFAFLNFEDLKLIYSLVKIRRYPKDHILVKEGANNKSLFIVIKGLLRTYYTRTDGSEITVHLAIDGMETASPHAVFSDMPAKAAIVTIEPSLLLVIDYEKFDALAAKFESVNRVKTERMKHIIVTAADRIEFYTVLSPEERFLYIQQHHPEFIQRVPQKYLASYIGITPISLSRIKARIAYGNK